MTSHMKTSQIFLAAILLSSSFAIGADDEKTTLPFGSAIYDFSRVLPHMKRTRLDLRITGGAQKIRAVAEARKLGQQAILNFPVRMENRSDRAITAYVANEWYGGEWPRTDLYAAVRKSGDKSAPWTSHEVYVSGETGHTETHTWKPGDVHEFSLRLNWPGTGSVHGGTLLSESIPGKYSIKVFLIFRSVYDYGFEYAESPEMEVEVEAGRGAEPAANDGWSETVGGLRTRLVFGEGRTISGTRLPEVYLELHNASDSGNPMEFDFNGQKSLQFELRTADGKPAAKPAVTVVDGTVSGPFHIAVPRDGTLRFPVTWIGGYSTRPDSGTQLCFETAFWEIPRADQSDYFLSATLEIPQTPSDPKKVEAWHGSIKIPAVKAPTKK